MSIPVACQCGQRFMAQPHLAGQLVNCPTCGGWIDVPHLAAAGLQPVSAPSYVPVAQTPQYAAPPSAPGYAGAYGKNSAYFAPSQQSSKGLWIIASVAGAIVLLVVVGVVVTAAGFIGYQVAHDVAKSPAQPAAASPQLPSSPATSPAANNATSAPFSPPGGAAPSLPGAGATPPVSSPFAAPPRPPGVPDRIPLPPAESPAPKLSFSPPSSEPAKPTLPSGWRTYSSNAAQFSVGFPGIKVDQPRGVVIGPMVVDSFTSITDNGGLAMVLVHDVSSVDVGAIQDRMGDQMLTAMIKASGGHDIRREDITMAGYPGTSARFVGKHIMGDGVFDMRIVAVRGWIYHLVWVTPVGKGDESDADTFFASFQLLGKRG